VRVMRDEASRFARLIQKLRPRRRHSIRHIAVLTLPLQPSNSPAAFSAAFSCFPPLEFSDDDGGHSCRTRFNRGFHAAADGALPQCVQRGRMRWCVSFTLLLLRFASLRFVASLRRSEQLVQGHEWPGLFPYLTTFRIHASSTQACPASSALARQTDACPVVDDRSQAAASQHRWRSRRGGCCCCRNDRHVAAGFA